MDIALKREIIVNKTICRVLGVAAFVILTALGAFVRIPLPFTPVPITLQTLFVLLAAVSLGANLGGIVQFIYITLGILGLPIFSQAASGLAYLAGPTAGYLFGFILASLFAGRLIKYVKENFFLTLAVLFSADLIILLCGTAWLGLIFGYPVSRLLMLGFFPFIPGDLLKVIAAAVLYSRLRHRLSEIL